MSLHKLSAGDGYTYLTRQVAAADDTHRGHGIARRPTTSRKVSRPAYGSVAAWTRWPAAAGISVVVGIVTEAQMTALFGAGRHPNADVIERRLQRDGAFTAASLDRGDEARPRVPPVRAERVPDRARRPVPRVQRRPMASDRTRRSRPAERARIRTELAREWFRAEYGRDPLDAREFTGYLTRSRVRRRCRWLATT